MYGAAEPGSLVPSSSTAHGMPEKTSSMGPAGGRRLTGDRNAVGRGLLPGGGRRIAAGNSMGSSVGGSVGQTFEGREMDGLPGQRTIGDGFGHGHGGGDDSMVMQDSEIKVVSYNPNKGLKMALLALGVWNLILTYAAWQNSIFTLGGNSVTLNGRDLMVTGNLRVSGNVLVAAVGDDAQRGRGNIVVGNDHNFDRARNSVIVGRLNTVTGVGSSVLSGQGNTVHASYASILGGTLNRAEDLYAAVAGGEKNKALARSSAIPGGYELTANLEHGFMAPKNDPPPPTAVTHSTLAPVD